MSVSFKVFTRLGDLLPVLSAFGENDLPVCPGIDTVEKSSVSDLQNYYVLTLVDEQLACVSYYQLLHVKPYHFNLGEKRFQQAALSLALRVVRPTLLVAGNLFRHDVIFQQFSESIQDDERRADLFLETTRFMTDYTKASGIFLKDVPKAMAVYVQRDETYTQMPEDVSMEMSLPAHWQGFDDYEKTLKHKYLQRCRKMRKSFGEIRVRKFSGEEIEQYGPEIEQLYLQVTRRQMVSMGVVNAGFFSELKRALKDDYHFFGYFHRDKLVAFASAITHDGEYDMNYIGFDYACNQSHHLYFNILFHCLECALEAGCHKLILGRTALEAKAIIGCSPDYRFSYYKLRHVVVNTFFRMVSSYFRQQQGEKWKNRHPFKSTVYAGAEEKIKIIS